MKKNKRVISVVLFICVILLFVSFLISFTPFFVGRNNIGELLKYLKFIFISTLGLLITLPFYSIYLSNKIEQETYSAKLESAIVTNKNKTESHPNNVENRSVDALKLMMINLENIKEFYRWGQRQAKASFILAFIMCILGFALMASAFFLHALFQQNLQIAIIPAIGGVITELVAGTVLVVYKSSLAQFNHYHKVLHEDARFLSSINLLDRFSTEKERDEMLKAIITSEIQMNIDELKLTHTIGEPKDKNKQ